MDNFLELLESNNMTEAYKLIEGKEKIEEFANEYNNARDIRETQVGNRQDKETKNNVVPVAKITIPIQRKIVKSACSFLFGTPVELVPEESSESTKAFLKLWKKVRVDSLLLEFCKTVKSETESAIVFFPIEKEGKDTKIKGKVLSNETGKIIPVWDSFGDMIAFVWEFDTTIEKKETKVLYVWTEEHNYIFHGKGSEFALAPEDGKTENVFGKIPVVYLSQAEPEWFEVLDLIDRFENSFSKFADTNDYFAHPTYKAKGGMNAEIKKDDSGRVIQLEVIETSRGNIIDADLDVLSWDRAPEALKLEFETTLDLIFDLSSTADFAKLIKSGIGNISGIALTLMFFNSILKSKWDQGPFGISVARCVNILKAGMINILKEGKDIEEVDFDVVFNSVLPQNLKETMEILSEATAGKPIMSQETAISHNPLVQDKESELTKVKAESEAESVLDLGETVEVN